MFIETVDQFAAVAVGKAGFLRRSPIGFWISSMMAGAYVGLGIILIFCVGANVDPSIRPVVMGASFGIALTLVIFQFTFRVAEAGLAAAFFRFFTPVLAASRAPIIWFGLGTVHAFGLEITPDCSSSLLLVPLCGLGILLMIPRRLNVGLVVRALIFAATVLVVVNTLRIGVIALCCRFWGLGVGYQVGHLVLGSLVSIVGIGLSLVLLTAIVASRRGLEFSAALLPRHRRRRS